VLEANHPETSYIENLGDGKFGIKALPRPVQYAPVNGFQVDDINNDGNLDLMLVGNDFGNEIISGRYDALNGVVLLGNGKGDFKALTTLESGFVVPGDAKALARLNGDNKDYFIATQNRDSLKVYTKTMHAGADRIKFKPAIDDVYVNFVYSSGEIEKREFYHGSGYLTQSSRSIFIPVNVEKLIVYSRDGSSREISREALLSSL
jgi:hypothetical protein